MKFIEKPFSCRYDAFNLLGNDIDAILASILNRQFGTSSTKHFMKKCSITTWHFRRYYYALQVKVQHCYLEVQWTQSH